jgi:hypothetical protein
MSVLEVTGISISINTVRTYRTTNTYLGTSHHSVRGKVDLAIMPDEGLHFNGHLQRKSILTTELLHFVVY